MTKGCKGKIGALAAVLPQQAPLTERCIASIVVPIVCLDVPRLFLRSKIVSEDLQ